MDLCYYNSEVDKIIWDIMGSDTFTEDDFQAIVDTVTDTIYQYDKKLGKNKLGLVVRFLVENKYQKYYVYDLQSEYNQVKQTKKINNDSSVSDIITLSDLKDIDDDSEVASDTKTKYINSEITSKNKSETIDKVQLSSAEDLVSHRHDYKFPHTKKQSISIKVNESWK